MSLTAIHIRTGEAGLNRIVENWLQRHQIISRAFADAYEACVYLIKHAEDVPDFAFIGADWLIPEELPIIRYLHETWPSLGVVIYAGRRIAGLPEPTALRAVCTAPRVLDKLLELEPDNLLSNMRASMADDPTVVRELARTTGEPQPRPAVAAAASMPVEAAPGGAESPAPTGDSLRNKVGTDVPRQMEREELWMLSGQED